MHILIAEDNDINWEIISYMLNTFGIIADRAENGQVCVDMVSAAAKDSYDLIFMDVQMPKMNGLDATRAIRRLKDHWAASIPIIAMTADAFSENRRKKEDHEKVYVCVFDGINDYGTYCLRFLKAGRYNG